MIQYNYKVNWQIYTDKNNVSEYNDLGTLHFTLNCVVAVEDLNF